jgi:hypothetical protein
VYFFLQGLHVAAFVVLLDERAALVEPFEHHVLATEVRQLAGIAVDVLQRELGCRRTRQRIGERDPARETQRHGH